MGTKIVPAEPYDFTFDPERTALLVIDMQRDFVYPGGFGEALGNDTSFLLAAVAPTQRVLAAAREKGCSSSTPARGTVQTSPTSRRARRPAVGWRVGSATPARWDASWSAASTGTASSKS